MTFTDGSPVETDANGIIADTSILITKSGEVIEQLTAHEADKLRQMTKCAGDDIWHNGPPEQWADCPHCFDQERKHVFYECEPCCDDAYCQYCIGGLSYCTVCKKGEVELEPICPGPQHSAAL